MNSYQSSTQAASNSGISEVPTHAAAPYILSRRTLRKVLNQALGTPSQFDAFLIDFYPEVFNQTAASMDRETKLNLLFLYVTEDQLTSTLRKEYPELVQRQLTGPSGEDERRSKFTVVLSAIIDEMDVHKVYALLTHLRRYTNDSELTIEQLRSGSVIITCTGCRSGFSRLHAEFSRGRLSHLLGYRIKDIALQNDPGELNQPSYLRRPQAALADAVTLMAGGQQTVCLAPPRSGPLGDSPPPSTLPMGAPVAFTVRAGAASLLPDARADAGTLLGTAYTSRSMGAAAAVSKPVKRSLLRLLVSFCGGASMAAIFVAWSFSRLQPSHTRESSAPISVAPAPMPPLPLPAPVPVPSPKVAAPPVVSDAVPPTPSPRPPRKVLIKAVPPTAKLLKRRLSGSAVQLKTEKAERPAMRVEVLCAESVLCKASAAEITTRICLNRQFPGLRLERMILERHGTKYTLQRRPAALSGADMERFVGCVQSGIVRLYGPNEKVWPSQLLITPGGS